MSNAFIRARMQFKHRNLPEAPFAIFLSYFFYQRNSVYLFVYEKDADVKVEEHACVCDFVCTESFSLFESNIIFRPTHLKIPMYVSEQANE